MAVKKINIPVGFQFDDPSQMLGKLKKAVDGLNLDSSLGKQMTSAIQKVEKDIAQLEQRAARGVSSDSDVAALSRGLESVVKQLNSIQEKSRSLTFKDIKLTPDQQKAWETLKQNVASARQELSQFQRSKLTELFKTDPNFSKVLQEQLEMTEDTVKNANQVENALRRQLEVLKSQVEEKRKLVVEDAKQAGVGSAARAEFAGLVDQFSDSKNKNRFGNGQADQGRLAFADFFKKIGVAATEADKVVKGSLQNIQKYFTSISGSEEFDKKLETDQAALSALEQQMADTQKASKTLENAMSLASRSAASDKVEEATRNQKDYEQQVVNLARANNTLGESAEEMGKKVASAGRQAIQTVQEQFTAAQRGQNMYDSMVASIQRLVGFTAVFTQVNRGIREAVSQIKELDSAMNAIAVVTDFTTEELWGQIDAYMGMARQYGVTTTGVYQVSQLYYQQGHDTAAVMDLTTETLKMARIAALDYSEATDYMTTALNGFKIEAEDAQRVTDVYSKLASIAATNTEELAKSMSNTAAIAASAGMSFESTSAMLAMMIEQTREAPEGIL